MLVSLLKGIAGLKRVRRLVGVCVEMNVLPTGSEPNSETYRGFIQGHGRQLNRHVSLRNRDAFVRSVNMKSHLQSFAKRLPRGKCSSRPSVGCAVAYIYVQEGSGSGPVSLRSRTCRVRWHRYLLA